MENQAKRKHSSGDSKSRLYAYLLYLYITSRTREKSSSLDILQLRFSETNEEFNIKLPPPPDSDERTLLDESRLLFSIRPVERSNFSFLCLCECTTIDSALKKSFFYDPLCKLSKM